MKQITEKDAGKFVNEWVAGKKMPLEMFICKNDDNTWTAIDNTDNECYVDDFATKEQAIMRNIGYLDSEGYPYDSYEICQAFVRMIEHINSFEGDLAGDVFVEMNMPRCCSEI